MTHGQGQWCGALLWEWEGGLAKEGKGEKLGKYGNRINKNNKNKLEGKKIQYIYQSHV